MKGQNKSRGPTYRVDKGDELCSNLINVVLDGEIPTCERKNCQFLHDIKKYLELKAKDLGDNCYNYQVSGKCARGLSCRFGSEHITTEGTNKIDQEKLLAFEANGPYTINTLKHDVQIALRKRTYDFKLAEKCVKYVDSIKKVFS